MTLVESRKVADLFYFVHYVGAIHIPIAFLYFVRAYFLKSKKVKLDVVTGLILAELQLYWFIAGDLVAPLTPKWKFTYYPNAEKYYIFYMVYFAFYVTYSFILMFRSYSDELTEKKRKVFFIIATAVGFTGGSSAFLLVYLDQLPPYGILIFPIFPILTTYAIVRYKFMDIEVIIKKTLVFAGLSAFVVACFSIPLFLLPKIFADAITGQVQLWLLVASGMAVAALVGPLNQVLVNVTDRFLFQKKESIKIILKHLSERIVTILDVEQIGRTILSTLVDTFRLESGMIVIFDKSEQIHRLLENSGLTKEEFVRTIKQYSDHSDIQEYFRDHGRIVSVDNPSSEELPKNVLEWVNGAKGRVCIPLFIDEHQNGFMMLGKKKSDQEFTQEEIDYFPTIASQTALAIRNARLVETVVQERESKVKAEHIAERVWFAATIKHEVKNRLGPDIEGPIRMLQLHYSSDLRKAFEEGDKKWFEETFGKIEKISEQVLNGSQAILDIADTTLGGIEADREKFRRNYFKILWYEAKKASGLEKMCDFESSFPDRFVIYGNYHILVSVFVNLIINAYDAMKDRDEKLIKLRASCKEFEGKKAIYFELEDQGPGIPENMRNKIFERGFSTKPIPRDEDIMASGHGQGLYVCKMHIEKIHHGKIWVESEPHKGAVFKFWIPMESS